MPIAPADKFDKLAALLQGRIFSKFGTIVPGGFHMPIKDGNTLGYCFVQYENAVQAKTGQEKVNGFVMGDKNTLAVMLLSTFEDYISTPDTYTPPAEGEFPAIKEIDSIDIEGKKSWLKHKSGRDQFAIRYANETQVFWSSNRPEVDLEAVYSGEKQKPKNWCESRIQWSPQGILSFPLIISCISY